MEPAVVRPGRILVVDDDPSSASALAALLREEGHDAVVIRSGADAMAALAGGACGLLLVDPSLRDRSGPRLMSYADERGVPRIVITADPAFDPAHAHEARNGDFLYKPIELTVLLGLVARALDPGRA